MHDDCISKQTLRDKIAELEKGCKNQWGMPDGTWHYCSKRELCTDCKRRVPSNVKLLKELLGVD